MCQRFRNRKGSSVKPTTGGVFWYLMGGEEIRSRLAEAETERASRGREGRSALRDCCQEVKFDNRNEARTKELNRGSGRTGGVDAGINLRRHKL
jgi:hypothetical protein